MIGKEILKVQSSPVHVVLIFHDFQKKKVLKVENRPFYLLLDFYERSIF